MYDMGQILFVLKLKLYTFTMAFNADVILHQGKSDKINVTKTNYLPHKQNTWTNLRKLSTLVSQFDIFHTCSSDSCNIQYSWTPASSARFPSMKLTWLCGGCQFHHRSPLFLVYNSLVWHIHIMKMFSQKLVCKQIMITWYNYINLISHWNISITSKFCKFPRWKFFLFHILFSDE